MATTWMGGMGRRRWRREWLCLTCRLSAACVQKNMKKQSRDLKLEERGLSRRQQQSTDDNGNTQQSNSTREKGEEDGGDNNYCFGGATLGGRRRRKATITRDEGGRYDRVIVVCIRGYGKDALALE